LLKPGETFYCPTPNNDTPHLWIVLTDANAENKAVCVNMTTKRSDSDCTTICRCGEHPFIKHESVINYRAAKWMDLADIDKAVAGGIKSMPFSQRAACTDAFLTKVRCGLINSKFTPKGIKSDCRPPVAERLPKMTAWRGHSCLPRRDSSRRSCPMGRSACGPQIPYNIIVFRARRLPQL
jgi:hypothetical protein